WVDGQPNPNSFYVPLNFINFVNVSNSVYRTPYAGLTPGTLPLGSTAPALIWTNYFGVFGMTAVFETNLPGPTRFYIPQWGLLTTNQLQVYILDRDASGMNHVIDYVNLEQSGSENLNNEIFNDDNAGVWNTNIDPKIGVPWGIYNQILISEGLENLPPEDGVWQRDMDAEMYGTSIPVQQADFQAFFYPYGAIASVQDGYGSAYGSNDDATVQAPYAPTRYAVGYSLLEANDPLVHYLASDLQPSFTVNIPSAFNNSISNVPPPAAEPATLGRLNYNFQPWGGNPYLDENTSFGIASSVQPDDYDLMERDPLVFGPDDWDFPTNQTLAAGWLGQVHRGTPWQTLYLKSPDILSQRIQVVDGVTNYIGTNIWSEWTGDTNLADAANMAPVEDWDVVGILAAMFNTNNFASLVSVNEPNTNAWQALLDGLTALTNTLEFPPILISSNSPQAAIIANGIESTRLGQPAHFFHDLGDFLATPQLSVQSPFLNLAATNLLTDEDYEIIPSQLLSLLRADSFGSVVSANGQTVFQFTGDDSQSYLIEASPDLVNWTIISTNQPVNGVFTFTNLAAPNAGTEFYRSVLMN
ncbi:MAG TPA: hypothetical protein VMH30_08715, partial [Verrucomicrobiae bacterium]|nr:hypothetical protein [Verrucomicrobiae bacterium]